MTELTMEIAVGYGAEMKKIIGDVDNIDVLTITVDSPGIVEVARAIDVEPLHVARTVAQRVADMIGNLLGVPTHIAPSAQGDGFDAIADENSGLDAQTMAAAYSLALYRRVNDNIIARDQLVRAFDRMTLDTRHTSVYY